jgi:hypothetical protein
MGLLAMINKFSITTDSLVKSLQSTLSREAIWKLCCVLSREIEIYLSLFDVSDNLDGAAKREAEDRLRDQCGISPDKLWREWETTCEYFLAESTKPTI